MAYFANSSEGDVLTLQCEQCRLPDDAPCPILGAQLAYNYDQVDKGQEMLRECLSSLVSNTGRCHMKPLIDALSINNLFGKERGQ